MSKLTSDGVLSRVLVSKLTSDPNMHSRARVEHSDCDEMRRASKTRYQTTYHFLSRETGTIKSSVSKRSLVTLSHFVGVTYYLPIRTKQDSLDRISLGLDCANIRGLR